MGINPGFVTLGVAAVIAVGFLRYQRKVAARAIPISPTDPLWLEAVERARSTVSKMQALHADGHEIWIKFVLGSHPGEREHVWGLLLGITDDTLRVTCETPPVDAHLTAAREQLVRTSELEDWQVALPDGTIHGGYTTRAQIEFAQREGRAIPSHIQQMVGRFANE